ncbi:MAG TPA: threonine ammonia-lyase [Conexibacter sp.]|nr:threonine ammonia-lyase [Conexibacter sp.]
MSETVDLVRIRAAASAAAGVVRETPVLSSRMLSERVGGAVALKAENLQRTGSFKLRGALAKLAALGAEGCRAGVVAGSAGNHGQAVAYAARELGVPCEIFMPEGAPITKVEACRAAGAEVRLVGGTVDDAVTTARERATSAGLAFVHPFDDPDVVAGQGGVGLELAAQLPGLARVVVPLGGGGLASGIAIAVKALRPEVDVIGVQVDRCAPFVASLGRGAAVAVELPPVTIADGIAVKRPGELTLPLVRRWVDEVVVVGEDDVAEAMVVLLERSKLVVEGAGAVGVAALLSGAVAPASAGTTAVVLSGGNVDVGLLASLARHHESLVGRRLVLVTTLPDRPGELGRLLALVAAQGANLLDVVHLREGVALHVRESAVQLVLETRDRTHARAVAAAVTDGGYALHTLG